MSYAVMPLSDYDAVCDKVRERASLSGFEDTDFGYIRSYVFSVKEKGTYTLNLTVKDESKLDIYGIVFGTPDWEGLTSPGQFDFVSGKLTASLGTVPTRIFISKNKGLKASDITSATLERNGQVVIDFSAPLIKSGEMADRVEDVFDAGKEAEREAFWANFFKGGVFGGMFSGGGWNVNTFKPVYPAEKIAIASRYAAERLFSNFNRPNSFAQPLVDLAEFCEHADFSQCPYLDFTFSDARAKNLTLDLSSCTGINRAFGSGNGGELENIRLKVTATCTAYPNAFFYQSEMKELHFTEDSVIAANISFAQSSLLSDESINSIINALQDRNGSTTLTLTVHKNVYNRMVADGRDALVTAKNWTLVSA